MPKGEQLPKYNTDFKTITFKVPVALVEHIQAEADKELVSRHDWCREVIRNVIKEMNRPKPEPKEEEKPLW